MTICCVTRRWTIKLLNLPKHSLMRRQEQAEDPQLSEKQNRILTKFFMERIFLPVFKGEIPVREAFIPAGGWARMDAQHPDQSALSPRQQFDLMSKL